jgi:hypothetical protein
VAKSDCKTKCYLLRLHRPSFEAFLFSKVCRYLHKIGISMLALERAVFKTRCPESLNSKHGSPSSIHGHN